MKVREVIKKLEQDGWQITAMKGSHRQFEHPTKPGKVTVAGHPRDEMRPKTLRSIERQSGLTLK